MLVTGGTGYLGSHSTAALRFATFPSRFLAAFGQAADLVQLRVRTRPPWDAEGIWVMNCAALRAIEPLAVAAASSDPFPYMVFRYGLESSEWGIDWCERARAELAGEGWKAPKRGRTG